MSAERGSERSDAASYKTSSAVHWPSPPSRSLLLPLTPSPSPSPPPILTRHIASTNPIQIPLIATTLASSRPLRRSPPPLNSHEVSFPPQLILTVVSFVVSALVTQNNAELIRSHFFDQHVLSCDLTVGGRQLCFGVEARCDH